MEGAHYFRRTVGLHKVLDRSMVHHWSLEFGPRAYLLGRFEAMISRERLTSDTGS